MTLANQVINPRTSGDDVAADGSLERSLDSVVTICAEGLFATAGQYFAWNPDEEIDAAIGSTFQDLSVSSSDVGEVFCLTKPVVAVAALLAIEQESLDPFAPVGPYLGLTTEVGRSVTPCSIINHATTLKAPPALTYMLHSVDERPGVSDLYLQPNLGACYSEIAGWLVLSGIVEELGGLCVDEFLRTRVTGPVGIGDEVAVDEGRLAQIVADRRLSISLGGLPVREVPLLHAFAPAYGARINPALGGLASARALGIFTRRMVDVLNGLPVDGFPACDLVKAVFDAGGLTRADGTWNRPCAFAMGFEFSESWRREDGAPSRLLMLSSFLTMACVAVDVDLNTGMAMWLNGGTASASDLAFCRDQALSGLGYSRSAD